jgi:hypothetical protein
MGREDIARILERTLKKSKAADRKLTVLAARKVNPHADGHRPTQAMASRRPVKRGKPSATAKKQARAKAKKRA